MRVYCLFIDFFIKLGILWEVLILLNLLIIVCFLVIKLLYIKIFFLMNLIFFWVIWDNLDVLFFLYCLLVLWD